MRLHHQVTGSGPPLIIVHGLFGSANNWAAVSRRLGEVFRVFALDMRNHGDSPNAKRMTYDDMAGDVLEFMEMHDVQSAHLIGHSMGGKVAMRLAQRDPGRLEKLVVVDIAPRRYEGGHEPLLDALSSLEPGLFRSRGEVEAALSALIPDRAVRQFFLTNIKRDENGRLAWKINLRAIRANYISLNAATPSAGPFREETLFVLGGRSRHVSVEDEPTIRRLFPAAEFSVIGGSDHWVHADAPDRFHHLVLAFLSR
jgi:esterase